MELPHSIEWRDWKLSGPHAAVKTANICILDDPYSLTAIKQEVAKVKLIWICLVRWHICHRETGRHIKSISVGCCGQHNRAIKISVSVLLCINNTGLVSQMMCTDQCSIICKHSYLLLRKALYNINRPRCPGDVITHSFLTHGTHRHHLFTHMWL